MTSAELLTVLEYLPAHFRVRLAMMGVGKYAPEAYALPCAGLVEFGSYVTAHVYGNAGDTFVRHFYVTRPSEGVFYTLMAAGYSIDYARLTSPIAFLKAGEELRLYLPWGDRQAVGWTYDGETFTCLDVRAELVSG